MSYPMPPRGGQGHGHGRDNLGPFAQSLRAATRAVDGVTSSARASASAVNALASTARAAAAGRAAPDPAGPSRGGGGGGGARAASDASAIGDAAAEASSGLDRVSSQVMRIGTVLRSALGEGLAPLTSVASRLQAQFDAFAGAALKTFRRVDAEIRFPKTQKALTDSVQFFEDVSRLTAKKVRFHFIAAFYKVRRDLSALKYNLSLFGDVDSKPLSRLSRVRFDAPAAGARTLASAVERVSPAAVAAGRSFKRLGFEVAAAFGFVGLVYKAVSAVSEFVAGGVKGAVDLNETLNATDVTFGKAAGSVKGFADTVASQYGLVRNDTLQVANGFGDFARAVKKSEDDSASFAQTFTALAADLSSFKNLSLREASAKLTAGLKGEFEPLIQYVGPVSEATVRLEALRLGLARGKKELSDQAKVAARASIIQKRLGRATGDLARTQYDAANQFRKAGGGLENFATSIGQVLLPAVKLGVNAFNDLLSTVIEVFEANRPVVEGWADRVSEAVSLAGKVVRNLGDYWEISKLKFLEFAANTLSWVETFPANFTMLTDYVGKNWHTLLIDLVNGAQVAFENLLANAETFGKALWDAIQGKGFSFEFKPLLTGFEAATKEMPKWVRPGLVSMQAEVDKAAGRIADREKARAEKLAAAAKASAKVASADDEKLPYEGKFAEAAEAGSKEAYSAILKYQAGPRDEPIKDVAKTNRGILAEAKATRETLRQYLEKTGQPLSAFTF